MLANAKLKRNIWVHTHIFLSLTQSENLSESIGLKSGIKEGLGHVKLASNINSTNFGYRKENSPPGVRHLSCPDIQSVLLVTKLMVFTLRSEFKTSEFLLFLQEKSLGSCLVLPQQSRHRK